MEQASVPDRGATPAGARHDLRRQAGRLRRGLRLERLLAWRLKQSTGGCAPSTRFYLPVRLYDAEKLTVGARTEIGCFTSIWAGGGVTIGSNCWISSNVGINSASHPVDPVRRRSELEFAPIVIGDDVWIGFGAFIMKGVTIGDRAIIGAGSIVTRDVAADTTVVGVPARPMTSSVHLPRP